MSDPPEDYRGDEPKLKFRDEHVWGEGTASLSLQYNVWEGGNQFWTCGDMPLTNVLYVPGHGLEEMGVQGLNIVCLKALERDGFVGHAQQFSRWVHVDMGGDQVSAYERVVRLLREGYGGWVEQSVFELVLCRRAEHEAGHRCGRGFNGKLRPDPRYQNQRTSSSSEYSREGGRRSSYGYVHEYDYWGRERGPTDRGRHASRLHFDDEYWDGRSGGYKLKAGNRSARGRGNGRHEKGKW